MAVDAVDPVSRTEDPEVATPYGAVRGRYENGIAVFRGIPYAAPPFGPRRFRPPEPPEPWDGVRDAGAFGPTPPKPPYSEAFARLLADPVVPGDDCLNLNVWTPEPGPGARLPVMVWIHGGALTRGSSAVPVYDGRAFARDGVVFVSFNYRLGVEGYGLFPDAPANPGLRDQLAALEWVHRSITQFGGDPGRVTVFGESAGAISIGALLASPRARGLFHRAVLQSGPPEASDRDKVRRMVRRMATRLKVPATAEAFAAVDRELLLRTQADVGKLSSPVLGGPAFGIVVDGDVVPRDPLEALVEGAAPDIDLLLGWTSEEYRLWLVPGGLLERVDLLGPVALAGAMARCHCGHEVPRGYRAIHPDAGTADLVGQMVTDHLLRVPLHRLADARRGRTPAYVYEFAWPSNVPDLGACHALELGFVFDTADVPESAKLAGPGAPQELAEAMHTAWVRFAVDGDPGWAAWDASHPVRIFGTGEPHTVHGPRDRELALWDAESGKVPGTPAGLSESTTTARGPAGSSSRATAPLSAVRRFRRSGGAGRW
ncbi:MULTISPECIES: carboxylesterase family protein [unclassified Streptomyces]|uniref:carboxylesterase/lipase family protein n=1 Tax=unclassified Streptomyces TaxID=2593676 RepID=UPI002E823947|nr:carboxylesterase family protein [Streptomyces sp. NBC_00589]WTI35376.1 carboxylesterase family protein [Streptomyces sp. NBC_00775]WUB30950.1 carboxylesterase family protein [Streptomyces sp. NBC_00589]